MKHGAVELEAPAEPDGWSGYWWAYLLDYEGRADYSCPVLVREADVERAQDGEEVDVYVPGLMGCVDPQSLLWYMRSNCGFETSPPKRGEYFVVKYRGKIFPEYRIHDEDADVFEPVEVLEVYDAVDFMRMADEGAFDEN